VQGGEDLIHPGFHLAVLVLLDEIRGDGRGHHAEQRDAGDHENHGDRTPSGRHRVLVAVAHAGHGDHRPPQRVAVAVDVAALGVSLERDLEPGRHEHDRDYQADHVVQSPPPDDLAGVADSGAYERRQAGHLQQPESAQLAKAAQRAQSAQRPQERQRHDREVEHVCPDKPRPVGGQAEPHAVVNGEQRPDHVVRGVEGHGHGSVHRADERYQQHRDHQERERGHRCLTELHVAVVGLGAPPLLAPGHVPDASDGPAKARQPTPAVP
jgi:hypothetical protein